MRKDHQGPDNDFNSYKKIKKGAKKMATKNLRNKLKRSLLKDIKTNNIETL